MNKNHVLLCHCDDQVSLISSITQILSEFKANIIQIEHHRICAGEKFKVFIRIEWEHGLLNEHNFNQSFLFTKEKFNLTYEYYPEGYRMKLALFVSKMNHCSNDILHRHSIGDLDCDISLIISNHQNSEKEAQMYGVPYYYLPLTKETKQEIEKKQISILEDNHIDFCVLARYMQILSPEFTHKYSQRIINIHHSFLPSFEGANPYKRAFERGVKLIGATSHYVTEDLDEGPIIEQNIERVSNKHNVDEFIRIGRDTERLVLSKAIRYHIEHRIIVYCNKTIIFDN